MLRLVLISLLYFQVMAMSAAIVVVLALSKPCGLPPCGGADDQLPADFVQMIQRRL